MKTRQACGWMLATLLMVLTGCNAIIAGNWRSIEPSQVPADVPRIREVRFESDGHFQGRMTRNSRTYPVAGTYQFDGSLLVLEHGTETDGTAAYSVERIGSVLLLTQNQVTHRLCRDSAGTVPSPAPSEELVNAAASRPAPPPPSSRPATQPSPTK